MITIQHKWGADYLAFNEPVNPAPVTITSPQGVTMTPGQRISRIGRKKRTSFCLVPGIFMTYEGLFLLKGITYAIFYCPAHDALQMSLFEDTLQYRYAFACVFTSAGFQCFLMGRGGPAGMADIVLDLVE